MLKLDTENIIPAMRIKLVLLSCSFATASLLMVSCGSQKKDEKAQEFAETNETLKQQIQDVVYNIPSPTEIPYLLQATGAEFNESLLNDRKKVSMYTSRNDKAALNLGVYAADIGYLTSYEKTQQAIDYLGSCKELADKLGVIGSFDAEVLKQFESNISNKDSLTHLLDRTIRKTENFLKDDNRNKLSALVVAGSFIEGLYISTGLIKSYPKEILPKDERNLVLTPLIRVVLQQRKSAGELLKMLSAVEQTDPVVAMVADLTKLDETYAKLNIEEQIKNNQANLILSDANLTEITVIVERLRKGLVE